MTAAARPTPRIPRVIGVDITDATPDAAAWSDGLYRLLTAEIRRATARGLLTTAEADQLLARLVLVIDQTVSP